MNGKKVKIMDNEMIAGTEAFLRQTFADSAYFRNNPKDRDYRLEHSYRVANIAKSIDGQIRLFDGMASSPNTMNKHIHCRKYISFGTKKQSIANYFL